MINKNLLLLNLTKIFLDRVTSMTCDQVSINHLSEEEQNYIIEEILEQWDGEYDPNYISSPILRFYIEDEIQLLSEKCDFLQTVCEQMNNMVEYNHEFIKAPELKQWLIDNKKSKL